VPSLDDLYTLDEPAERDSQYGDQEGEYQDSEADDATVMSMPAYTAGALRVICVICT
jgi:hypothetical protein